MKLKIKKKILVLIILLPIFFFYSILLLSHYTLGDQILYIRFYEAASNISFEDVLFSSINYLGNYEPISIYTLWAGAKLGVDKIIYISFFNLILLAGTYLLLINHNTPWYVIIMVLTNFYLIVLMTGAERLKFSYIILIYALLLQGNKKSFLIALSPAAHMQSLMILISLTFEKLIKSAPSFFYKLKIKKTGFILIVILIFLAISMFFFFQEIIIKKIYSYTEGNRSASSKKFSELINVTIILFIGLLVAKQKVRLLLLIFPMIVATYYLGGSRVNMISFSLVFYILLVEKRLNHPLFLVILIYLSLKSIPFVRNIFLNNNGYDGFLF